MVSAEAGQPAIRNNGRFGALAAPRHLAPIAAIASVLCIVAALAGWLLGGKAVAVAAAALAVTYAAVLTVLPAPMLMHFYGARAVPEAQAGRVGSLLHEISVHRAGLDSSPRLYVLPSLAITAFSLGTGTRAALAVSEGLLRHLTLRETAGMLAHEVHHIRTGDTHLFAFADAATRIAQLLAVAGVALLGANAFGELFGDPFVPWSVAAALVAAPLLMSLVQFSLPHTRELEADAEAVRLTGDTMGLAGAIRRLPTDHGNLIEDILPPAFARRVPVPSVLRLHPLPGPRIERLLATADPADGALPTLIVAEEPMLLHVGFGPAEMRARYRWPGVWW